MSAEYLRKYREGWYVRVRVPRDLRAQLGVGEIKRTLKTRDKKEAQYRKHAVLAEIMATFDAAKNGLDLNHRSVTVGYQTKSHHQSTEVTSIASDQVEQDPQNHIHKGIYSPIGEILSVYLDEKKLTVTNQTFNAKKRRLNDFVEYIGIHSDIKQISKRSAGDYVTKVLVLKRDRYRRPLSVKTKKDIASDLRAFFHWAEARGYIETNPFSNVMTTLRSVIKGSPSTRRGWNRPELVKLLCDDELMNDKVMAGLILIGLYSGMRGNEIAELRLENVTDEYMRIVAGKNTNSVRKVPIHRKIAPLVRHLKFTSTDDYLLEDLKRGGEDKKRYHNIGKRFNRRKDKLGFSKDTVFHSFRHSLATALENAEVPRDLAEMVVGHSDQNRGLTYSLYSDGLENELLAETMNKANYGPDVELIVDRIIDKHCSIE